VGYRNYSVANGFTVDKLGNGDFTTIGAALIAAVSGQTIFIRPGTYTENPTLKAGVNLTAFDCDSYTPNVIINGECSFSSAGTVSISGIQLQTNSSFCLAVTGSAASVLFLDNCYINALNNTAISYSSSSSSSSFYIYNCNGNVATTGIGFFACSAAGTLTIWGTLITNTGATATPSTISSGQFNPINSELSFPITVSGTAGMAYSNFEMQTTAAIPLTVTSSGAVGGNYGAFNGASNSAITIALGSTFRADFLDIFSSATNAITGSGTIRYGIITYTGTSSTNNVTTQTPFVTQPSISSGSLVKIQTLTASASANISFTSGITATYNTYFVVINGLQPATNASQLLLTLSTNGGSSYLVTGYKALCNNLNNTGAGGAYLTTAFNLSEAADISNSATLPFNASFYLYNLTNGTTPAISGTGTYNSTVAGNTNSSVIGGFGPTTITVNAIQFIMSTGNITAGTFTLYGVTQ
jgi:hypothetical protein